MKRLAAILIAFLAIVPAIMAQRQISPVQPGKPAPPASAVPRRPDMSQLAHRQDEQGNIVLVDTVTGTEYPDTLLRRPPKMEYPLLHSITIGLNIWDCAMRAFGQKYGCGDALVAVGLHNRYFPTFEAGLSTASDTPAGLNFTYRSPIAPYFKIGADYNFLYNSNPAYKLLAGVRYGFSSFRYSFTDITVNDAYWHDPATFDIPSQTSTAGYLELQLALRVKIAGPFCMGWAFKYHKVLHQSVAPYGNPMVIPGYGKLSGSITGAFSLFCTLDLAGKRR